MDNDPQATLLNQSSSRRLRRNSVIVFVLLVMGVVASQPCYAIEINIVSWNEFWNPADPTVETPFLNGVLQSQLAPHDIDYLGSQRSELYQAMRAAADIWENILLDDHWAHDSTPMVDSSGQPIFNQGGPIFQGSGDTVVNHGDRILSGNGDGVVDVVFFWDDVQVEDDMQEDRLIGLHQSVIPVTAMVDGVPTTRIIENLIRIDTQAPSPIDGTIRAHQWFTDQTPHLNDGFNLVSEKYALDQQNAWFDGSGSGELETSLFGQLTEEPYINEGIFFDKANEGIDLLTVALHELGHALGLTGYIVSEGQIDGVVLGPEDDFNVDNSPYLGGSSVTINRDEDQGLHLESPWSLMHFEATDGRRLPSETDILAIASASGATKIATDEYRDDGWHDRFSTSTVRNGVIDGSVLSSSSVLLNEDVQLDSLLVRDGVTVTVGSGFTLNVTESVMVEEGSALVNEGSISPGSSPGEATFVGDLEFGETGALIIEIDGFEPGTEYDVVHVTGNVSLAGSLELFVDEVFASSIDIGAEFTLLSFGSRLDPQTQEETFFDRIVGVEVSPQLYLRPVYDATTLKLVAELPGDADLNGVVGLGDLGMLLDHLGDDGDWASADFNSDGVVSLGDLGTILDNLGRGSAVGAPSSGSQSLPEPTTLGLIALGGVLLLGRRRVA